MPRGQPGITCCICFVSASFRAIVSWHLLLEKSGRSCALQCDAAALATQAEVYAGLLRICLTIPMCKVFEMWGFTDGHTWLSSFNNPTHMNEMPLPFDTAYQAKPAFFSMLSVLTNTSMPKRTLA